MADLTSTRHRQYSQNAGTDIMRRTAITPGPHWKPTYARDVVVYDINTAEMIRINQEFIDAGAADDNESPLCFAVHNGIACRRAAMIGERFCREGQGDA